MMVIGHMMIIMSTIAIYKKFSLGTAIDHCDGSKYVRTCGVIVPVIIII